MHCISYIHYITDQVKSVHQCLELYRCLMHVHINTNICYELLGGFFTDYKLNLSNSHNIVCFVSSNNYWLPCTNVLESMFNWTLYNPYFFYQKGFVSQCTHAIHVCSETSNITSHSFSRVRIVALRCAE